MARAELTTTETAAKLREMAALHRRLFGDEAAEKEAADLETLAEAITTTGEPTKEQMLAFIDAGIRLVDTVEAVSALRRQRSSVRGER